MSLALSTSPSPRRGRNGSSDGSERAATARWRSFSSRSASSRYSSSAEVSKISRCSAVAACSSRALTSGGEPAADLRHRGEQLVAEQPERRLQRLGGTEELLLAGLPLGAQRDPGLLHEG